MLTDWPEGEAVAPGPPELARYPCQLPPREPRRVSPKKATAPVVQYLGPRQERPDHPGRPPPQEPRALSLFPWKDHTIHHPPSRSGAWTFASTSRRSPLSSCDGRRGKAGEQAHVSGQKTGRQGTKGPQATPSLTLCEGHPHHDGLRRRAIIDLPLPPLPPAQTS